MRERRRDPRVPIQLAVTIELLGEEPASGHTIDLSARGALLTADVRAWHTGEMTVQFDEPASLDQLTLNSRVVRVQGMRAVGDGETQICIGVEFTDLELEEQQQLEAIVAAQLMPAESTTEPN